ncbi:HDOD domain-containing protein [Tamilnaduibacter salinus]|uniref:HDOD domain-containing protein n=1 Tax=Tamilnaduibacter salinus TaxID=1484056 RepID=A0A2A2I4C4_9GAMM|nr:response regulator [Tamilnaduibacter salinus]PAV25960.1 two-component system response regulator [Tamilnaduibacter salinus]PVY76281.1 HDOD domain-containing protein [Tamilnaduibacter salinus]
MQVLIIEDDPLVQGLIASIVEGIYNDVRVFTAESVTEAEGQWSPGEFVLLICDWQLPDGSGLTYLKSIRQSDPDVRLLMITARSDRQSVLAAARVGIDGFVTKPFQVEGLRERLISILPPGTVSAPALSVDEWLSEALGHPLQLPSDLNPADVMALQARRSELTIGLLATQWQGASALVARLMDAANRQSLRRAGQSTESLRDAVAELGVERSMDLALSMSLDIVNAIDAPGLVDKARQLVQEGERRASLAAELARQVGVDVSLCRSAGLLSNLGELGVITALQRFIRQGGELPDDRVDALVGTWSSEYGNRLKRQWRLPLELREHVGALYDLRGDAVQASRLVMRYTGLLLSERSTEPERSHLEGLLGIAPEFGDTLVAHLGKDDGPT